ncbi:MAG: YlmH/Sll1252 family protein [Anaerorhabdus sp.]
MKNKKEQTKGSDSLLSRLSDWVSQVERDYRSVATPFLNESEIEIVKQYCGKKIPYCIDGGHLQCKRAKIIFLSQSEWVSDIVCLSAKRGKMAQSTISHRDVLGALMNLNIERNQLGDHWVDEERIVIYTSRRFASFIQQECTQIGRESVRFEISDQLFEKEDEIENGTGFISSERIDAIVSCMTKGSRSSAQLLIQNQRVMINHILVTKTTKTCKAGDIISIRGFGRFIYKGILKISKKNRYMIDYEKLVG